ncbi:MAG: NADH-quinone oxidoreductase subunit J family protein [Terriglobales bacterium]
MLAPVFFFCLFAGTAVLGALLVITLRNTMHCALALIVTLLAVAGLFVAAGAEFLAGAQVMLYVGGIMVLFLFVIMLVNLEREQQVTQTAPQWVLGLLAVLTLGGLLGVMLLRGTERWPAAVAAIPAAVTGPGGNSERFSMELFQHNLLAFELVGLLLLIAMIGAVVLAKARGTRMEE